jgi:hypothetical protein
MSQTSYSLTIAAAFAGMLADTGDNDIFGAVQAESSLEIPFGVMVCKGTGDNDAKLPAAADAKLLGVLVHSHSYEPKIDLGTTGVKPGAVLNVLNSGRVWVLVEENVTREDRAYVRYAAGAGGTQLGAFRKSAVSNETIDVRANVKFVTSASSGGLAIIEADNLNTMSTGPTGAAGESAYTTTAANFNMPAEAATVVVTVVNTGWAAVGMVVFVAGAGHLEVTAKGSTSLTLKNIESTGSGTYPGNAAPSTTIASGALVVPAGVSGP